MSGNGARKRYLPNSKSCFVCGEDNPAGLRTRFWVEEGLVKTLLEPATHHCGYDNVVHGGIVATILDETMGWAANRTMGRMCVTAELKVRYVKPVPGDRTTLVCACVTKSNKRIACLEGWIEDDGGERLALSEARFLPLSQAATQEVDAHLIYRGGEERPFGDEHTPTTTK